MRIKSMKARAKLAQHLTEHDENMLEFFKAAAQTFGLAEEVRYTGQHDDELLKELKS